MAKSRADRLKAYLELIAGTKDIRELQVDQDALAAMHANRPSLGGVESLQPLPPAAHVNEGLEALYRGDGLDSAQRYGIEAIIIPDKRPAIPLAKGTYEATHPLWLSLNDPAVKDRLTTKARGIGRIEVPGSPYPYGGTGFHVGPGLIMTNRHVAEIFARGLGDRAILIVPSIRPGFGTAFAPDNAEALPLRVKAVRMIHPYWDMALLEVEGLPADMPVLTLEPGSVDGFVDKNVAVIGYPAFDPRNDAAAQKTVFDNRFGIKQLQPGVLRARFDTESFQKVVSAVTHDCSTLGGNSGSAIIHIDTGQVLGLHFGGAYLARNYGVPSSELALDGRVVDAGVTFNPATHPDKPPSWSGWWTAADEASDPARGQAVESGQAAPPGGGDGGQIVVATVPPAPAPIPGGSSGETTLDVVIPLHVTIRIGQPHKAMVVASATEAPAALEKLVEPVRDTDYANRQGFDEHFLGAPTPMPKAAKPSVLARTTAGKDRLDYQNFSIRMHAQRRLALVVASNVFADSAVKTPEAGKLYTRKDLGGLGPRDQEKWFVDPRLGAEFQLPDAFYTRDGGAFDKGHIARRDDVAWGTTYDALRRANGDSFHVTNCSPQVAGFNRSTDGTDNWGDLENVVLQQAASERLCVFAGPVLADDDPRFLGLVAPGQRRIVQIPTRFWKVIVARTVDGLAAFAFVLDQDLSSVSLEEFTVPKNFAQFLVPLPSLAAATGVSFDQVLLDADEFDARGRDVAMQSGSGRREAALG